jgi:uncharacterized protein YegP (UPF0339 family)
MKRPVQRIAALVALVGALGLFYPAAHAQKDKSKDTKGKVAATGAAVFEMYNDKSGEVRFRLNDAEGTLLATSGKGYKTKPDCQKVIDTIKREAARAKVDDQAK